MAIGNETSKCIATHTTSTHYSGRKEGVEERLAGSLGSLGLLLSLLSLDTLLLDYIHRYG